MPYRNEHACRLRDPKNYVREMRIKGSESEPDRLVGVLPDGKTEVQSLRFPTSRFARDTARRVCESHGGRFEPAVNERSAPVEQSAFATLNANIQAMRTEHAHGKDWLVAPVVMTKEGVHAGSSGPYYYDPDEIAKYVGAWDGRPVVVDHPYDIDGTPISANAPAILERQSVGTIYNTRYDAEARALKAEAWIDVERLRGMNAELAAALLAGTSNIEVSTGMWHDDDGTPGEWNGKTYQATIRNIRPDHLALLPDAVGACSWQDGCGVRANEDEATEKGHLADVVVDAIKAGFSALRGSFTESGSASEEPDEPGEVSSMKRADVVEALLAFDAFSDDDREWLESLDDERLEQLNKFAQPGGEPEAPEANPEANAAQPCCPPVDNEESADEPVTLDAYIAAAPPEVRDSLLRAMRRDAEEKDRRVKSLLANKKIKAAYTECELRGMPIEELARLAKVAAVPVDYSLQMGGATAEPAGNDLYADEPEDWFAGSGEVK